MEFSLGWILLGLPLAFALGWLASRFDLRQIRIEDQQAPKSYFKGLNYLLNEQQDQAIDAFIEAVQKDPETSELHFALGNLFRRRGEYERAVRVHEHLLSRADLSQLDRERAQHALALDFLKAGLLDRAEEALQKLEGTAFETQARLALLANYERSRDWALAAVVAHKLEVAGQGSFAQRLAHYLCEQASLALAQQQNSAAQALLQQAVATAPQAPRPRMMLAQLQADAGDLAAAQQTLLAAMTQAPAAIPLLALPLARIALRLGQPQPALERLLELYGQHAAIDVLQAIVALAGDDQHWYARHLEREPSLIAAARWIAVVQPADAQLQPHLERALDHAVKPLLRYRCAACGFEASQHFWHCPGCQTWDSYPARRVEEL